jgi:uncharacterized membrane protein YdjX (TVP38/TMEM64 family)
MADMPDAVSPETKTPSKRSSILRPLILVLLVVGMMAAVRYFRVGEYLEAERLRAWINAYGIWAPLIYLAIWTVAPSLLALPGLPITLAGGVLFGKFWGVVYTALGATMGATLGFLVARYLARDWLEAKLAGTKLAALDEKVARHGWKIVAFTRLIPIFPYNLQNYAYGLTRIPLFPYILASFFCMLPATVAFIYFSSNLLDLLHGKISQELVLGVLLVVIVSLAPFIYKWLRGRREDVLEP